jgi:hypothetical protein
MSAAEIKIEGKINFLKARECNVLNISHWSRFAECKYYKHSLLLVEGL